MYLYINKNPPIVSHGSFAIWTGREPLVIEESGDSPCHGMLFKCCGVIEMVVANQAKEVNGEQSTTRSLSINARGESDCKRYWKRHFIIINLILPSATSQLLPISPTNTSYTPVRCHLTAARATPLQMMMLDKYEVKRAIDSTSIMLIFNFNCNVQIEEAISDVLWVVSR